MWLGLVLGFLTTGSLSGQESKGGAKPGGTAPAAPAPAEKPEAAAGDVLRVGDTLLISYSDIPNPPSPSTEQIREDGKVTLHLNYDIVAAGKSRGELEKEIRALYVDVKQVYREIKISVQASVRFVSVGGEVRVPGNVAHPGELTVVKAINSSGGFTEYANRRKVLVIRAGKTGRGRGSNAPLVVNYDKASKNPDEDLPLYPGDRVQVNKKLF